MSLLGPLSHPETGLVRFGLPWRVQGDGGRRGVREWTQGVLDVGLRLRGREWGAVGGVHVQRVRPQSRDGFGVEALVQEVDTRSSSKLRWSPRRKSRPV